MKHRLLILSTVSALFFGSILVSCRATFVSVPSATGSGTAALANPPVETVSEQPKVVVVNHPVRVRETRPATQPAEPVVAEKRWAPLVITASPAEIVKEYADGRKYIKSKDGYFYWKGFDHRWYMEENDLKKVSYSDEEYIDWTTKGKRQSNSIAGANEDKNTAVQPGNSAFGHSRGNGNKFEKPEKEKNANHANGLAKEDKSNTVQPGNSAFGHSRGNGNKVEIPEKEMNANDANGSNKEKEIKDKKDREEKQVKEKEEKARIEKEVKDKKAREEEQMKEKEEEARIEKEAKNKKEHDEKLVKEKEEKARIEKEIKVKKEHDEKQVKESAPKDSTENVVKDEKAVGKKPSGEKVEKQNAEKGAKKGQDKPAKDHVKKAG
jgi:hypothetical protein